MKGDLPVLPAAQADGPDEHAGPDRRRRQLPALEQQARLGTDIAAAALVAAPRARVLLVTPAGSDDAPPRELEAVAADGNESTCRAHLITALRATADEPVISSYVRYVVMPRPDRPGHHIGTDPASRGRLVLRRLLGRSSTTGPARGLFVARPPHADDSEPARRQDQVGSGRHCLAGNILESP
jgi:hypothetical protein